MTLFLLCAALQVLHPAGRTELPGYTGDFDHFEYDLKSNRLWLAAEDHGTLDLFDLRTGAFQKSYTGVVGTPHGVLFVPERNRLIVTDSADQTRSETEIVALAMNHADVRLGLKHTMAVAFDSIVGHFSARRAVLVVQRHGPSGRRLCRSPFRWCR